MTDILQELRMIKQLLALQKKVLSLDEFCIYANISKSYAYHLTSTGRIKFYRPVGKLIYFDIEDVIDFLMQNPIKSEIGKADKLKKYVLNNLNHLK